jgi:lysyl-tRNA synthetase class 2
MTASTADSKAQGRVLAVSGSTLFVFNAGQTFVVDVDDAGTVSPGDLVRVAARRVVLRIPGPGQWPPDGRHPAADLAGLLNGRLARLQRRSLLLQKTRGWFTARGFTEVETPLIVPSPGTETHLDPVAVRWTPHPGAQPTDAWLITSPEYAMKRLLVAGAGPIFQLGRVFRDGERGGRHRPEFTMLEWYRPWVDDGYESLFADCEDLLTTLAGANHVAWGGKRFELKPPWPRITFFDALRERADIAHPRDLGPEVWLTALVERVEPTLGAEHPEFLTEWPIELASLSRRSATDPAVSERFELYLGQLELANAFAELTDADEQRARCMADNAERTALGRPPLPLDERFLGALAAGMPPSTGIALGFDRLVMILTDAATIDEVSAF